MESFYNRNDGRMLIECFMKPNVRTISCSNKGVPK